MPPPPRALPARSQLLPALWDAQHHSGYLSVEAVSAVAARLQIPRAEAWEVATSYPEFCWAPESTLPPVCTGLTCVLNGARVGTAERGIACQFRCYEAPLRAGDAPFEERFLRVQGPLLRPDQPDGAGLARARSMGRGSAIQAVADSGLRGRGGAYFPTGRKWQSALAEARPLALVVNAEEGEPGVFKDRALFCTRPERFVEGLAIAMELLQPDVTVIFVNGEARAARASLEAALQRGAAMLPYAPVVMSGGGGYVLGEESVLLNAIEGKKPVPRTRPPYPVEAGLFGMPTVINNVETIASLAVIFRDGVEAYRSRGMPEAPGTKLFSVSGRVERPGIYEVDLGTPLLELARMAGGDITAALCGGPSGGFLPASEFDRPLLPGPLHPTGAVAGSGNMVLFDATSDLRAAAIAMAAFNADESCGKCTPCREGTPRVHDALVARDLAGIDDLLEVVGTASLCGLGQMAPGPVRSALHFWPGLFR